MSDDMALWALLGGVLAVLAVAVVYDLWAATASVYDVLGLLP